MDNIIKKIIIVGAGIGGLAIAKKLALKNKYDVTLFEKGPYGALAYDWSDDVEKSIFDRGLVNMPSSKFIEKKPWTFVMPFEGIHIYVPQPAEHVDYSIDRRLFSQQLADEAEVSGAKILFKSNVEKVILDDNNKVIGVVVDDTNHYADLVIDSAGLFSSVKNSLPQEFNMSNDITSEEIFYAYRAYYERNEVEPSKFTNKVYIKHLGGCGISWCIDRGDVVDVLIGLMGVDNEKHRLAALEAIKKDNPCLGDKLLNGGKTYQIPIKYPALKMVTSGYAAIGNSAYMTIPLLGSGIAASIKAAAILADVIDKTPSSDFNEEVLWEYQVRVFKLFGADYIAIDYLKRWLLGLDIKYIRKIVKSGLLSESELAIVARGDRICLSVKEKLKKLTKAVKSPSSLLKLNYLLMKMDRGYKIGMSIPTAYDINAIAKWQKNLNCFIKSLANPAKVEKQ
ncbi:MAG: NAD(P)-binding protein [Christensenellaceae bacterium]|jgi:flavin-dependent dehydrogenase|nr:NAD(P)-binding protein [Christensenellaceae bacterium]